MSYLNKYCNVYHQYVGYSEINKEIETVSSLKCYIC